MARTWPAPQIRAWFRSIPTEVALLVVCAGLFYAIGAWWGVPYATGPDRVHAWGTDDDTPLGPLTQIHEIIRPQPNPWLSYPLMHTFVAATTYAPYFLGLVATGQFTGISATYPFGLADPVAALRTLSVIAHLLSVVMAALAVGAAAWIGRALWGRDTGVLYGTLVLFSFPLVYYARVGNVDATAAAFTMLAVAAFVDAMNRGLQVANATWLGVFTGAALATKESSVGLFVVVPLLLSMRREQSGDAAWRAAGFWRAAAAGGAACLIVFGVGSGLFVAPRRYFAHLAYLRSLLDLVSAPDVGHPLAFGYTPAGHLGYLRATVTRLAEGMTVPGVVLAVTGIGWSWRARSRAGALAVLPLVYVGYLFLTYRLVQIRYLMPAMLLLLGFTAHALVTLARTSAGRWRVVAFLLGAVVIGQKSLVATEVTYEMLRDSRYAAGAWLSQHTGPGSTLAYFGPSSTLPPLEPSVNAVRATEERGLYWTPPVDDQTIAAILARWEQHPPTFIITMPDYTSHGLEHARSLPPRLFARLLDGSAGADVVAEFHTPALIPWLPMPALDYAVVNPHIRIFRPKPAPPR